MTQENEQPDIPDRQLLRTNAGPRVTYSREIGEATITHTIFGKAKVRIVRRYDSVRRVLWLGAMAGAAAVAWQVWRMAQPVEVMPSADSVSSANDRTPASVPAPQPEVATPPAVMPLEQSKSVAAPVVVETAKAGTIQPKPLHPVPAPGLKSAAALPKPIPHPLPAVRPQLAPHPASGVSALNSAKPLPPGPAMQRPLAAPVAAAPHPAQTAAHPAASSPALAVPLAAPAAAVPPPVGAKPVVAPASAPAGN